jgi:diguanylate cyclase
MTSTYNPWLVSLSIVVAVLVSFTSLNLASRVADSRESARVWLLLGAITMGVGIWSMHFIGMLAFSVPIQLRYHVGLTLLSLGVAIVTSGFAIHVASRPSLGFTRHLVCSLMMGLGIVVMHYIGMSAIAIVPAISYDPTLVAASAAIAVTASYAALWLTFTLRSAMHRYLWAARLGAAAIMGLAISGMHYVGMASAEFRPGAFCRGGVALDPEWLAVSVTIAALALLFATLIAGIFDAHVESRTQLHRQRLHMANTRLNHQQTHDALTTLPNRSAFLNALQSAIDRSVAGNSAKTLLAVMLVDLDRFKIVNDSLGHEFGDAVLQEVARRLQHTLGDAGIAARLGGDEFLVMLQAVDTQSIIRMANRILERLSQFYEVQSIELHLAASVGITTYPFDRSVPYVLLSHADEAMYEAKHRGGNGFQFFVPGTTVFTMQRLELENDLRNAVALGQLELHYQPQVEVASGKIVGLEALARWKHPSHGWIPPGEFIPLAEASDLIVHIGKWILDEACRQAKLWQDEGFGGLKMAVNLSARQFRQPDLLSMIRQTVGKHGLQPEHIVIELTESVVMSDANRAVETLEQMHQSGFEVAVDDFGTGYSSMSYLKRLPVSELKIDQSFVSDLGSSAKSDSIVRAIISLAHGLGMTVIAEGVETAAQLSFLRAFGCDQYQGYLYSRPRNAADTVELLRSKPQPFEGDISQELLLRSAG